MGDAYPFGTIEKTFGSETFRFKGLSLPHIMAIIGKMEVPADRLFQKAITGELQANPGAIVLELGDSYAEFVGMVLAFGVRDPSRIEWFANEVPVGYQIEMLEQVAKLTIESSGGPEKLLGIVIGVLQNLRKQNFLPT